MEKLDRLGWAAGLAFTAYGRRIGVRVNRPEALDQVVQRLPFGWRPAPSPLVDRLYSILVGTPNPSETIRRLNLVYAGSAPLARTRDLGDALEAFESHLHLSVAAEARGRLFVHAGVVGWRGRAILIPGRTLTGKSRLVAALVRAGATYYSDEYAVLDAAARVHPYARSLSIRENGGGRALRVPVETLGGAAGTRPLPVGMVLVTRYRPGARWRPIRLSPGQATLALLAETPAARTRPAAALRGLRRVADRAVTLKGVRGEADESAALILQACDRNERASRFAARPGGAEPIRRRIRRCGITC